MTIPKKQTSKVKKYESPVIHVTRSVAGFVRLLLCVRAGGRCEFDGCNQYLFEHHVTLREGNFGQFAHIVAFKPGGPRGRLGKRPKDINDIENLMLLCPPCHKLIDDNPNDYSIKTLEEHKERHEKRIRYVTGLGPDQSTSALLMATRIGKQTVSIPYGQIVEAVSPRYPIAKPGITIDLTQIPDDSSGFIQAACSAIDQRVRPLFETESEVMQRSHHISVFALAPIPLLIYLGSQLSNKVPIDVYQRHRDTESWTWKKNARPVNYVTKKLQKGTDRSKVALILSLSGKVKRKNLPKEIDKKFSIYELTLKGKTPKTTFLKGRVDLENFRITYQETLGTLLSEHGIIKEISLFPAVPAPVAVLCGRELLPKVHPNLRIYDFDKTKVGFKFQLEVNNYGH